MMALVGIDERSLAMGARSDSFGEDHLHFLSVAERAFRTPAAERDNAVLQVTHSAFPPDIESGDLICVDFTKTEVCCDGLFIVAAGAEGEEWIGIRRFQLIPQGVLISNRPGEWEQLAAHVKANLQILGHIKAVYKRS